MPGPNYYGATLVTGAPRNATIPPPPHPWEADAWAAATPAGPPSDVQPSGPPATHSRPRCLFSNFLSVLLSLVFLKPLSRVTNREQGLAPTLFTAPF